MRRRLTWIAIIVLGLPTGVALLFICAGFAFWLPCDLTPVTELTRVDASNNRSVAFYADTCWEGNRGVFYEVQENGQTIIPRPGLGYGFSDSPFKVVSAENKSLVAVYTPWTLDDDTVLVLIDFGTREAWHTGEHAEDNSVYSQEKAKGLEMFKRLKQANPYLSEPKELLR
jgi:hypothetical protein